MTLNARELADVCAEVEQRLVGRPLQKIVQTDATTVHLGFALASRGSHGSGGGWLLVCVDAEHGRMHLEPKLPGTGEAAPPFCMLLRKHLIGARLVRVTSVAGERACSLEFGAARLLVFLYGRSAQLVLVGEKPLGAIGPAKAMRGQLPPAGTGARADQSRFGAAPSTKIAQYFAASAADREKQAGLKRARAQLQKRRRLLEQLEGDLSRGERAAENKRAADLLLAQLGRIPRGTKRIMLDDFSGGKLEVALNPALSAQANAARMYKDHKRLLHARARIEERLAQVRSEVAQLERVVTGAVPAFEVEPVLRTPSNKTRRHDKQPPYRMFRSATGAAILVGRGAERNDELTFKVARGADLWLHARDATGAHVVVPLAAGKSIDPETLVDAATLAAYHSSSRDESQADVSYTLRKNVRKPKGAKKGAVSLSGAKTIRIRVEPERLRRLLTSRVDDK